MKSALLARQLDQIFGPDGEQALARVLQSLPSEVGTLGADIARLLELADLTYTRYAETSQAQSRISGDNFSDWNWRTRRIDSGRGWLRLLDYGDDVRIDTLGGWRDCLHPEDKDAVLGRLGAHLRGEAPVFSVETRMRTRTGGWKWILVRGQVVQRETNGEPTRLLIMHRDVGDVKRAESRLTEARDAAESASRARGAFLANMSHEIRTPMNAIIGMAELVAETQLSGEQRHYVNTVRSSAESLLTILNDVLDLSKIEAGKLSFETIPFSLTDLVLEAGRVIAVSAHKKGLDIAVDIGEDVPSRLVGDPTRLRQVLTNLLGNAVKFTATGEIVLEVVVAQAGATDTVLNFSVRDTGIGIPADKQQLIFEAFSQADDSTTRQFGGTGLGLTISTRLVEMMGGRIWLESTPGQGSTFWFSARFGVEPAAARGRLPENFRGRRALLVEPQRAAAGCIGRLLARLGIRTDVRSECRIALDDLRQAAAGADPYSLLIVSAEVPESDASALADAWTAGAESLIFLLTTQTAGETLARLRRRAGVRQLVKPVGMVDLVEALTPDAAPARRAENVPDFELAPFELAAIEESAASGAEAATAGDILLVEDNPVNQELAQRLLQKKGYRVVVAGNGAEALECLERRAFDAILMDMQMPVLGGVEATEAIRAREMRRSWVMSGTADLRPAYIIAMTANAMAGDRERCLAAGMNDYISKPIRAEQLYAALTKALDPALNDGMFGLPPDDRSVEVLDLAAAEDDVGDRELLVNLARMLLADWNGHLARIAAAITDRDAVALQMHGHTLKGLMATFHAADAQRQAARLEAVAQNIGAHTWDECRRIEAHLGLELERVKAVLERFVN